MDNNKGKIHCYATTDDEIFSHDCPKKFQRHLKTFPYYVTFKLTKIIENIHNNVKLPS